MRAADVENATHDRIDTGIVSSDAQMVPLFNPLRKTEFLSVTALPAGHSVQRLDVNEVNR